MWLRPPGSHIPTCSRRSKEAVLRGASNTGSCPHRPPWLRGTVPSSFPLPAPFRTSPFPVRHSAPYSYPLPLVSRDPSVIALAHALWHLQSSTSSAMISSAKFTNACLGFSAPDCVQKSFVLGVLLLHGAVVQAPPQTSVRSLNCAWVSRRSAFSTTVPCSSSGAIMISNP